jgi:pimeloyl-ACP methyl ester carboxylesterase
MLDGPWNHRFVNANGTRFHVVESGTGPLVMLLHGFPEFWYAWHQYLPGLAAAGYRAVAVDLRGYGASDKPPRGYDAYTMAADVVGLIRALGERRAVLVGAGYGGMLAWTAACFHPQQVQRLVVVGAAHPLRLRAALLTDLTGQLAATMPVLRFQIPRYEHALVRHDSALIGRYLRLWAGSRWVRSSEFGRYEAACRQAMAIPQAAFCAMEAYRWNVRSVLRLQGHRFVKQLQQPIVTPTLQIHGAQDTTILPGTARGSRRHVIADYEWRLIEDTGHFPHQEAPDVVMREILRWIDERPDLVPAPTSAADPRE